ncbi:hypothetical protein E1176_12370 [Fulvivirga sp. RKSG066]|uniref:AHH domain-containing protein n=1 Tax=Fulvivirga aurantia TaxID=2529383 RepID=UPI0012BB4B8A|nr:AHH domain-containing protein [Fulvivirga aurantia]MTI21818.1 hypothetical protein [Fulvivirga aurantia]
MASEIAYADPIEQLKDKAELLGERYSAMEALSAEERKKLKNLAKESASMAQSNLEDLSISEIIDTLGPLAGARSKAREAHTQAKNLVKKNKQKAERSINHLKEAKRKFTKPNLKKAATATAKKAFNEKVKEIKSSQLADQGLDKLARQYYRGLKIAFLSTTRSRREKAWVSSKFKRFEIKLRDNRVKYGSSQFVDLLMEQFPQIKWEMAIDPGQLVEDVADKATQAAESLIGPETQALAEPIKDKVEKVGSIIKEKESPEKEQKTREHKAKEEQDTERIKKEPTPKKKAKIEGADEVLKLFLKRKPTKMLDDAAQLGEGVKDGLNAEKEKLEEKLPEVKAPTGLMPGDQQLPDKAKTKIEENLEFIPKKSDLKEKIDDNLSVEKAAEEVLKETPGDITDFPDSLPKVDVSLDSVPKIPLEGERDPKLVGKFKAEADEKIAQEKAKANKTIFSRKGLGRILPKFDGKILKPPAVQGAIDGIKNLKVDLPKDRLSEVEEQFDLQSQQQVQQQIAEQEAKLDSAKEQLETNSDSSKADFDEQFEIEVNNTAELQKQSQESAKAETAALQSKWKEENEQAVEQYQQKSDEARKETLGKVDNQIKATDKQVEKKLSEAQVETEKATAKANEEAAKQKQQVKEDKSWWDKATDFVGGVFDKLKTAVNNIFEGLKSLVNKIVEAAKTAVTALIDVAKNLITGFIQTFGSLLKGLANMLFAAFPGIAEKFESLIDKAINKAIEAVDRLAEGLKTVVNTLLDTLGSLINACLDAYKAALNAILDVVNFIIDGLIKIFKGITNLVSSAKISPEFFFGQMSEELLGQDVTKPLPNERPAVALADLNTQATSVLPAQDAAVLEKDTYQPSEVEADQVVEGASLEPELMSQVAAMGDGASIEFGASEDDEHGMDAVKRDAIETETTPESSNATSPDQAPSSDNLKDDGLVGPFQTPTERAGYLIKTMKDGVVKWFSENKVAIIAGIVAGIAGVILANILTGGAIMAALPLLLQIIGAYFAAEGIYQTAKHFGGFLGSAWPGNLVEGATKLARGLAVLTIELVFALLFGGKAAMKGAKTAVKTVGEQGVRGAAKTGVKAATSSAKKSVKETAKAARDLTKVSKSGAKAVAKNGKVAMKGVRKGFAKGAKTFDDLGKRLSKQLRFKKFKLSVQKRRFKLEGEVNPWVLLASGKIEKVITKKSDRVGSHGTFKRADGKGEVEGYLVGRRNNPTKSRYVQSLEEMDKNTRLKELDELELKGKQHIDGYDSFDYDKAIKELGQAPADAIKNRGRLTSALGKSPGPNYNAHHIIPVELIPKSEALLIAIENGFDFNNKINGKWLKRYSGQTRKNKLGDIIADANGTHASHPKYSMKVEIALGKIDISQDPTRVIGEVKAVISDFDKLIDDNPTTLLNLL